MPLKVTHCANLTVGVISVKCLRITGTVWTSYFYCCWQWKASLRSSSVELSRFNIPLDALQVTLETWSRV